MPELAVVVVAYHGAEDLETCLGAVADAAPVVVVDNSADRAVAAVARGAGARYVDSGGNLGFAGGVNVGLRHVPPRADVLLLNPDAVLDASTLHALHARLHCADAAGVGALSPGLVDPVDGARSRVRWPFPTPGRMWREAFGLTRLALPPGEFCVGAVLLLRAEARADVGAFDERFFLYAEEADWQRRMVAAGWRALEVPELEAVHKGAGTSTDLTRREVLFHAGTETYVRKWHGPTGWASYRAAAVLGAGLRAVVLRGDRASAARSRARLYLRGPRRVAGLAPRPAAPGRRVVHVVVTTAFAGVERYVSEVAREQAAGGSVVTVVGGDPDRMRAALGGARHRPAGDVPSAVRELRRLGRQDVVHAHMTAAETAAVVAAPWHHAPVVATRHFARRRGSSAAVRALGAVLRPRLARQIAISRYVADEIGEPATVLPNGVRSLPAADGEREPVVLTLQRFEREKATDVALRAWAASGLGERGWQLHLAGTGALRPELERLAEELGVSGSVRFLGQVGDTEQRLRRAGLLLATATAEPFGLSVAEAMATGTPVVASDGGAHPELLGPGAWTFPAGDVAAAAAALQRAVASSAQRADHGRRLRDRQRELFDLQRHVEELHAVYAEVTVTSV